MLLFNRKAFKPIIDYVEGKMSATDFHHLFETDAELQELLKIKLSRKHEYLYEDDYCLFNYFKHFGKNYENDWEAVGTRGELQDGLKLLLKKYHILYKRYKKYENDYDFLLEIQPDWLDCADGKIWSDLIDSIPHDLSKTKRIAMGKAKIKELFRYDKSYPRWVQGSEWPVVNGKPLVFSHQERVKGDDYHYLYHFYDPDTKEETIVEQFS